MISRVSNVCAGCDDYARPIRCPSEYLYSKTNNATRQVNAHVFVMSQGQVRWPVANAVDVCGIVSEWALRTKRVEKMRSRSSRTNSAVTALSLVELALKIGLVVLGWVGRKSSTYQRYDWTDHQAATKTIILEAGRGPLGARCVERAWRCWRRRGGQE